MNSLLLNLLLPLLFSHFSCFLVFVPASAKVFVSIDCGSSSLKPHTNDNSIVWVGDDPYIQNGETHKVMIEPPNVKAWDSHVMSTLRAFPTRKKNCYSIDIEDKDEDATNTTVERVLVRASFYYGNYDDKSTPPTFNLQFNGNSWSQIVTHQDNIIYTEMVYSLTKGNSISICLAQTQPDNIPFISALEVRSLHPNAYRYVDSNKPLFFFERFAFGANTTIRYSGDYYDRIWSPVHNIRVQSNLPYRHVNIDDNPLEALRTSLTQLREVKFDPSAPSVAAKTNFTNYDYPPESLRRAHLSGNLVYTGISDSKIPIHYNAYFGELNTLDSTEKRSFNILVNNKLDTTIRPNGPVDPPSGYLHVVYIRNVTSFAINSSYSIALEPTSDSTLPPMINALEGFTIGDKLVQGTNSDDVYSLRILQESFVQLHDWNGDPCLPSPYTWDWVACNSDADSPRVTALYLNDLGLEGILPDFGSLDALEIIDLHNNNLMQEIPDFLGLLPKLKVL
ncbi:probable LRR receptor-like serine/threonine-protein kinase At1g51810 [Papaver somniferum]|nr:probable LRR receptor-like serine/threonine-protein kinase At1g51810 [Papaver somniferum]